jgi:hypothetical protein
VKKIKGKLWGKKEKKRKDFCAKKEKLYGDEMMRKKMPKIRRGEIKKKRAEIGNSKKKNSKFNTLKKRFAIFPVSAWMSLTKLSLAGYTLIIPAQGEFGKWLPGWGQQNR